VVIYVPLFQNIFNTQALSFQDLLVAFVASLVALVVAEIVKGIAYARHKRMPVEAN
jgi:hypothetical protein